jgi:Raf kinase inhibitor-like YbhB/YbcL family protein
MKAHPLRLRSSRLVWVNQLVLICLTGLVLAVGGCGPCSTSTPLPEASAPTSAPQEEAKGGQEMAFELTSTAFVHEESIPSKYTCDGDNVSPPLHRSDPPEGTLSLALIMDDPDAPGDTWVHWILYNLPSGVYTLPENISSDDDLPYDSHHGENSWGRMDYGGPCPPSGVHRYFFKLYALDVMLDLDAGATKEQLLQAMEGHILAQTELMGTYTRQ